MSWAYCAVALSSARKVETEEDWQLVLDTLMALQAKVTTRPRKLLHKYVNWEKAYTSMASSGQLWIVDGYLLWWDCEAPWYSDQLFVSELLIVRVERGGTLQGVASFLRQQARAAGAVLVAVGTAFAPSDRALSRLYQAEGFTPEAITLTMEP